MFDIKFWPEPGHAWVNKRKYVFRQEVGQFDWATRD